MTFGSEYISWKARELGYGVTFEREGSDNDLWVTVYGSKPGACGSTVVTEPTTDSVALAIAPIMCALTTSRDPLAKCQCVAFREQLEVK